ncbi:MAG: enoyl-CoA hydratase-related protein [Pseudomonadota bacterium]
MADPRLLVSNQGPVRLLLLNRPESRNSLDAELVSELGAALEAARRDASVRVIVLSGEGGAFSSGVDLRSATADIGNPERLAARLDGFHALIHAITGADQPVIAAVDGPAVGFGCDLALACDLRVASTAAYFEEKFVAIGLMPDGGGTFHLPRLIGLGRALEHLLLGTRIDAQRAEALGLVSRVVEPDALREEALRLARRLAEGPPRALAAIKHATRASLDASLAQALDRERQGQLALLATEDVREGVTAFLQRRPPVFQGR